MSLEPGARDPRPTAGCLVALLAMFGAVGLSVALGEPLSFGEILLTGLVAAPLPWLLGGLTLAVSQAARDALGRRRDRARAGQAERAAAARRTTELTELGGGDLALGRRIAEVTEREAELTAEIAALTARRQRLAEATEEVTASRYRDRAEALRRADRLLAEQVLARSRLRDDWAALARDLRALAAVNRAAALVDDLSPAEELDRLDDERSRLTAAVDELAALDEVERLLRDGM